MGWFGNGHGEQAPGHGERLAELERAVSTLTARIVKAEATAAECAERAYRYMKKAESRARRELDEPNQDPTPGTAPGRGTPVASSSPSVRAWGARARRGLIRAARPDPALELQGCTCGERGVCAFCRTRTGTED
jgi:hypothetical protein